MSDLKERLRAKPALQSEIDAADRIEVLERALGWYAEPVLPYAITQANEPRSAVHADGGKRARQALEQKP